MPVCECPRCKLKLEETASVPPTSCPFCLARHRLSVPLVPLVRSPDRVVGDRRALTVNSADRTRRRNVDGRASGQLAPLERVGKR